MYTELVRVDLNLLVVFSAVAETGSTTEAAKKLNLSQPAVSHALRRLRESLGDALFVRRQGRLVPTSVAQSIEDPVRRLLRDSLGIFRPVAFDPATTTRTFRLALSDYPTLMISGALAQMMRERAPAAQVQFESVTPQTAERLQWGELDAVVSRSSAVPPPLEAETLVQDRLVAVVHESHPLVRTNRSRRLSIDDYLRFKHVHTAFVGCRDDVVDRTLAKVGRTRIVSISTHEYRSAVELLPGSDLVLALPAGVLRMVGAESLVTFQLPFIDEGVAYDLVWDSTRAADDGVRWLLDQVRCIAGRARSPAIAEGRQAA